MLVLHRRSSSVLELHGQHAFVFSLGLCMFSCKITGTYSKSNGPNVVLCAAVDLYVTGLTILHMTCSPLSLIFIDLSASLLILECFKFVF